MTQHHKVLYQHHLIAFAFIVGFVLPGFGQNPPGPGAGQPETFDPGSQQGPPAYLPAPMPPRTLTLPAGAVMTVRLSQFLSSDQNQAGDEIHATLDQPVVVDGWVVARRGQTVLGRVAVAQKAARGARGASQLGVELTELILVDGQQLPLRTQLLQASGGGIPGEQQVATVAVPAGIGAMIGAAAGGGEGAGIGAVAGAAAGMVGVLLTPGKPTMIPAETQLTFRQEYPLTISTERSAQAFQPVSQQDYGYDRTLQYRPTRIAQPPAYAPGPPRYYRPYGYYSYPAWSYYPAPVFRFYYVPAPRVFVRPRVVVAPRARGGVRRGFRR